MRIVLMFVLLILARNVEAQWRKIADFPRSPIMVDWGNPAFVGTDDELYLSRDDGATWEKVKQLRAINDIARLDSSTMWSSSLSATAACWKTADAGVTWDSIASEFGSSVTFLPGLKRLFLTRWNYRKALISYDLGESWDTLDIADRNGMAFSSELEGIATLVNGDNYFVARTTDGGLTWNRSADIWECWQPAAIKGTQEYFKCGDGTRFVFRSSDRGVNWDTVFSFEGKALSGTVRADDCGRIYVQTTNSAYQTTERGFYRSSDLGETWEYLAGPGAASDDSRFSLKGKSLYAGKERDSVTKLFSVWQYVGPPLSMSLQQVLPLRACFDTNYSLTYSFADFCVGAYPEFVSANVSGSDNFQVSGDFSARMLKDAQSINVRYTPKPYSKDTTFVTLRFWTGGIEFDTTITLLGEGPTPSLVSFGIDISNPQPSSNEAISVAVKPDRPVAGKALNEMTFNVEYRDDLFALRSATSPVGAQIGNAQRIGELMVIPVTLTGTDLALDPAQPLVVLDLETRLTDSMRSTFNVTELKLNGGDIDYANCMLAATSSNASVDVAINCGEPLMQRVLRGQRALEITSIAPNPADDRLSVEWTSHLTSEATLMVFSSNGSIVHSGKVSGTAAVLDTSPWSAGTYTVRVSVGEEIAESKVVKR